MKTYSEKALINTLKNEDNASFEALYKFYFPSISSFVKQNKGKTEDAEDIFQEAIIILLQKIRQPGFILTSTLKTYLFAISKNIWLNRLRDNKLISVDDYEKYQIHNESFTIEIIPEKTKEEKVTTWLNKITENCQRILKAIFFYNEPMESLIRKMGWKNKHVAANQQYKCLQQMRNENIKQDWS